MTDDTTAAVESAAPAATSAVPERYATPAEDTYSSGDEGAREAAANLKAERDAEQTDPAFNEELAKAWPEAAAKRAAYKHGQGFVDAVKKHQELGAKSSLTPEEGSDFLRDERAAARFLMEQDLTDAILKNRETEAQQTQQQAQQQPQPNPQAQVNAAVTAQRLQEADRRWSDWAGKSEANLNLGYAQTVAVQRREFPDLFQAADKHAALAQLSPQRAARLQQLLAHERTLEAQWQGVQQNKNRYLAVRSGAVAQARQQQFAQWAAAQDAQVDIPEVRGPNAEKFRSAFFGVLADAGIDAAAAKNMFQNPAYRNAAAQRIIFAAARERFARDGLAEAKAKAKQRPAPRVMRPGQGNYGFNGDARTISDLSAQLSATKGRKQIETGAALIAARRRARGN